MGHSAGKASSVTVSYRRPDDLSEITREWPPAGIGELAAAAPWRDPHIVPAGYLNGLPVGLSFFSGAYQEPKLIGYAHAFEQATRTRTSPTFTPTLTLI